MKPYMEHHVILEADPATAHITGTVPGVPEIVVDGTDEAQVLSNLRTAIQRALEDSVIALRRLLLTRVASVDV